MTIEELREKIANRGYDGPSMEQFHEDKTRRMSPLEKKLWREAHAKAAEPFYGDVLAAFEITNHPMASKIYWMAWSDGHSGGYGEVVNHMYDLVDLIDNPKPNITVEYFLHCDKCGNIGLLSDLNIVRKHKTTKKIKDGTLHYVDCTAKVMIFKQTNLSYRFREEVKEEIK